MQSVLPSASKALILFFTVRLFLEFLPDILHTPSFFSQSATTGLLLLSLSQCWYFFSEVPMLLPLLPPPASPVKKQLTKDYTECNLLCVSQAVVSAAATVWRGIRTSHSPIPPISSFPVKRSASQSLVAPALLS